MLGGAAIMPETPSQRERGGLGTEIFIANERIAVVTSALSFLIILLFGIGLLLSAHRPWFPFEEAFARTVTALAGASLAGIAAFPLMQVIDRAEKIRILGRINNYMIDMEDQAAGNDTTRVLAQLVSELYGEPFSR